MRTVRNPWCAMLAVALLGLGSALFAQDGKKSVKLRVLVPPEAQVGLERR